MTYHHDPEFSNRGRFIRRELPGALGAAALALAAVWLGLGQPSREALEFRPVPDAAEHAWAAMQFAWSGSPLLPIANELHPSRYSPIHPWLMGQWVRLRGGGEPALFEWAPLAFLGGLALMWAWMARMGIGVAWRFAALAIVLASPLSFELCAGLLQEPTILLLFWAALLGYHMAMAPLCSIPFHRPSKASLIGFIITGAAAGAMTAALAAIRPTLAALGIVMFIPLVIAGVRRRRPALPAAFALGGATVAVMAAVYTWRIAGRFLLSGYFHWMPEFRARTMDWSLIHGPGQTLKQTPRADLLLREFMGFDLSLHALGVVSGTLLLGGVMTLFAARARGAGVPPIVENRRDSARRAFLNVHAPLLIAFLASQVAFHLIYKMWAVRFFVVMFPVWVVLGVAGLERAAGAFGGRWPHFRLAPRVLAAALFLLVLGVYRYPLIRLAIADAAQSSIRPEHRDAAARTHAYFGPLMARYAGAPVFVDRLPVLNARMLLEIEDGRIIAPMDNVRDLYWDGHTVQFKMFRVGPARGLIDPGAPWRSPPDQSWLMDTKTGAVAGDYLLALARHYPRLILYFNLYREERFEPLWDFAGQNGIIVESRIEHKEWVMVILAEGPGGTP